MKRDDIIGHSFHCPKCKLKMVPALGEHNVEHFRHLGSRCKYDMFLHSMAEWIFFYEYKKCLEEKKPFFVEVPILVRCNLSCILIEHYDCKDHYHPMKVNLTRFFSHIYMEESVQVEDEIRRPDLLLESDSGEKLWIEIFVTNSDETKHKKAPIIEIKIESEDDFELIRKHNVNCFERIRTFNYNPYPSLNPTINPPCSSYYKFECNKNGKGTGSFIPIKSLGTNQSNSYYRCLLRLNKDGNYNYYDSKDGEMPFRLSKAELDWILGQHLLEMDGKKSILCDVQLWNEEHICCNCANRYIEYKISDDNRSQKKLLKNCDDCNYGAPSQGNPHGPAIWCWKYKRKSPRVCASFIEKRNVFRQMEKISFCSISKDFSPNIDTSCEFFTSKLQMSLITPPHKLFSTISSEEMSKRICLIWYHISKMIIDQEYNGKR